MIPTFLKSLAATVRDLVASGKAAHVNKETVAELDLLAGLPWQDADPARIPIGQQTHAILGSCDVFRHIPITPADLALGWLLASWAVVSADEEGAWNHVAPRSPNAPTRTAQDHSRLHVPKPRGAQTTAARLQVERTQRCRLAARWDAPGCAPSSAATRGRTSAPRLD